MDLATIDIRVADLQKPVIVIELYQAIHLALEPILEPHDLPLVAMPTNQADVDRRLAVSEYMDAAELMHIIRCRAGQSPNPNRTMAIPQASRRRQEIVTRTNPAGVREAPQAGGKIRVGIRSRHQRIVVDGLIGRSSDRGMRDGLVIDRRISLAPHLRHANRSSIQGENKKADHQNSRLSALQILCINSKNVNKRNPRTQARGLGRGGIERSELHRIAGADGVEHPGEPLGAVVRDAHLIRTERQLEGVALADAGEVDPEADRHGLAAQGGHTVEPAAVLLVRRGAEVASRLRAATAVQVTH